MGSRFGPGTGIVRGVMGLAALFAAARAAAGDALDDDAAKRQPILCCDAIA